MTDWSKAEITYKAWGREGQLAKFNTVRNDYTKSDFVRRQADQARKKIIVQLQDNKLMAMRERLIKASIAGDERSMAAIQQQMRYYLGEDPETGSYEQR